MIQDRKGQHMKKRILKIGALLLSAVVTLTAFMPMTAYATDTDYSYTYNYDYSALIEATVTGNVISFKIKK